MGRCPACGMDRHRPDPDKACSSEGESIHVAELLVPVSRYMRSGMPCGMGLRRRDSDYGLEPFSQHSGAAWLQPEDRALLAKPHLRCICGDSSRSVAAPGLSRQRAAGQRRKSAAMATMKTRATLTP